MNLTPQSPELTAYVLGELPDGQRREVEAILAVRPDLQWEVDQLRTLTATVGRAFREEHAWTLSPARRRSILNRPPSKKNQFKWEWPWSVRDPRQLLPLLQWAGASVAVLACGLLWWESRNPARLEVSAPAIAYVEPPNSMFNTNPLASRSLKKDSETTVIPKASPDAPPPVVQGLALGREKEDLLQRPATDASLAAGVPPRETLAKPTLVESVGRFATSQPAASASGDLDGNVNMAAKNRRYRQSAASSIGEQRDAGDQAAEHRSHLRSATTTGLPPVKESPESLSWRLSYSPRQQLSPLTWSTATPPRTVRFGRVDDAGYRLVRDRILEGTRPLPEFVRLEELINYFRYEDISGPRSTASQLLKTRFEWSVCPWNPGHVLVRVALQWGERTNGTAVGRRLMLAVDGTKTGLFGLLPDWFGEATTHLMVSTDRGEMAREGLHANGIMERKFSALERRAAVPTQHLAGSDGFTVDLQQAYAVAKAPANGIVDHPVLLATPSERVIGVSATNLIEAIIRDGAKDGVRLDIVALGVAPQMMPRLAYWAGLGGGRLETADSKADGRRAFGELSQTTEPMTLAEWPTADLNWDTNRFPIWRGLGNVPTTGAITAFASLSDLPALNEADRFEYQAQSSAIPLGGQSIALFELAQPQIGFLSSGGFGGMELKSETLSTKPGSETTSTLSGTPPPFSESSVDFKFTTAVAGFGLLLRNCEDHDGLTWDKVLEMAQAGVGFDPDGTRAEFVELIKRARELK